MRKASPVRNTEPTLYSERTPSSTTTSGIFSASWNCSTLMRPISVIFSLRIIPLQSEFLADLQHSFYGSDGSLRHFLVHADHRPLIFQAVVEFL